MQRIYLPDTDFHDTISIDNVQIHHQLVKVLRMKVWSELIFFDGEKSTDYVYTISQIEKKHIYLQQQKVLEKNSEIDYMMTLYQAIPNKFSKLEYIVQKWVEVGYINIVIFSSDRSQKQSLTDNKIQRLQTIAKEAAEQCGANRIPQITVWNILEDTADTQIVFHPHSSQTLWEVSLKKGQSISLYVWPEWGFSDEEIQKFQSQGYTCISLWKRVLRCETVGVVTGFFLSQN